jgi:predicted DCC family thiol-disulfide oxidoreductase YuxK
VTDTAPLSLLYDGECPVCKNFVRRMRLQQQFGELRLLDARQPSEQRARAEAMGFDLNRGFVLFVGEEVYFADRAIQTLALMSSRSGLFNRLNYHIFRHPGLSRVLYPILASGRLLLLRLLGRSLIE